MTRVTTIGLSRDARHQYYANYADRQAGPIPGVTGTIGIMDKPAIVGWAKNEVAKAAVGNMTMLAEMLDKGGPDAAVKWLAAIPGYQRDKAADTGSLVHILVEKILRKREVEVPVELVPYAIGFRNFLETRQPAMVSVEQLCARLDGLPYGGTFDFIADLDGIRTLVDVKTWRKLPLPGGEMYAETAMQLAAYANAQFIGAEGDPKRHRMPAIAAHAVLHLRPDLYDKGWQLYPFHVTEADYEGFLGLLAAYRWKQTRARLVIGEPRIAVPKDGVAA
jgi:hypothetical protein